MRKSALLCGFFAIPLILFNLIFFLVAGTTHPQSVWISYVWIQVAFLLLIVTPWFARQTENGPVFRITLALISGTYCVVELIIGLIVIIIHPAGIKGAILAQAIPFCLYLFALLGNLFFIELAADSEVKKAKAEKAAKKGQDK